MIASESNTNNNKNNKESQNSVNSENFQNGSNNNSQNSIIISNNKKRKGKTNVTNESKCNKRETSFSYSYNKTNKLSQNKSAYNKIINEVDKNLVSEFQSLISKLENQGKDISTKKKVAQLMVISYNYHRRLDENIIVNFQDLNAKQIIENSIRDNIMDEFIKSSKDLLKRMRQKLIVKTYFIGMYYIFAKLMWIS